MSTTDPNNTDTTVTNPTSVGNSADANVRADAVRNLENGLAAQRTKDAEKAARLAKEADDHLDKMTLDDIEDLGLGETKGLNYNEIIKGLPDDAKKIVSNLRADYQRKTQAASDAKKRAEQIEADRKAMLDAGVYDKLKKDSEHSGEFDPFDADSVSKYIQAKIAAGIQQTLEPMHKQAQINQREAQIASWKDENPDWSDYKTAMFNLMQNDPNLKLEPAYLMAKGKAATDNQRKAVEDQKIAQDNARGTGLKIGGANRGAATGIPDAIKAKGAVAIYEYMEAQKAKR